jgi:hypothetical protein
MDIPDVPYVALYGTEYGDWRKIPAAALDSAAVAWYDPTDEAWAGIDETNGDIRQREIDALVEKELRALEGASCVLFQMTLGRGRSGGVASAAPRSLASRFELGFAAGKRIRTFAHIGPGVEGRHYLLAQMRLCSTWMTSCASLDEAISCALEFIRTLSRLDATATASVVETLAHQRPESGSRRR